MKTTKNELERKQSLYELASEYLAIQARLGDCYDGEEENQTEGEGERTGLFAELDLLEDKFTTKCENIVKLMRFLESRSARIDGEREYIIEEAKRLAIRSQRFLNRVEWLKDYMRENMHRLGITKVEGDIATINLGKPSESIEVDTEQVYKWPNDVWESGVVTEEVKVNRSLLKQLFKNTLSLLPGVVVTEGKPRLTIR